MVSAAAETDYVSSTAPSRVEFTLLMPCLNEAETLARCIRKARQAIEQLGLVAEVLIADNGSGDGSQEIARREGARVLDVPVRGYGAALYHGSSAAEGRYIIMGDADDSYDFSRIEEFVRELRAGRDLVMGNRFLGGIEPGAMPWKNRMIGNPVLSGIGKLFFACPVGDFHCGIRGYSRAAFDKLDLQTTGMEFASEMVIKATLMKLDISEVATILHKDGRSRPPHLRPWRDGWRHLRFMLLYSPRWLFLYPGVTLMVLGTVGGLVLLGGPVAITSHVVLDVHTLLVAFTAIVLGFQAVAFFMCARAYALSEGLLPSPSPERARLESFNLERGLLFGGLLFALGLWAIVVTFRSWYAVDFGPLDVHATLRSAILGVAAMCLGGQVILVSFLLSFLSLRKRRSTTMNHARLE